MHDPATYAHCLIATAFGPVGLAWSTLGLTRLQLPYADVAETKARLLRGMAEGADSHPPKWLEPLVSELQGYFLGRRVDFSGVPLDFGDAPAFTRAVYDETSKVGWGEVVTYGELAARAGVPGAARAVGVAMSRNPIPVIMPCHRVLASGSKIGGFSAPGGTSSKRRLLALEGVRFEPPVPAQGSFAFWA